MRSESATQTITPGAAADGSTPLVQYNAGTSAYRAGQFPQATQAFQRSIRASPESAARRLADQQDAYYNLGNALYRAGQQLEKSAPQEAIQDWTDAVKAYDTALQLRRDDADSKYNRDFVQRKIDQLRKPPEQGGGSGGQDNSHGAGNGQAPPQGEGQGHGQPPPQGPPPTGPSPQSPSPNSGNGRPPPPHRGGTPPSASPPDERPPAENQRAPGQMSAEEARELLDSAKSDEHQSLAVPSGPRDPDRDRAFKNL
jgi:tetratricopeptide (TPR) repeat protein